MDITKNRKLWAKVVAKSWVDEAYRQALVANPREVLTKEGLTLPEGVNLHVVDTPLGSTLQDIYLYLPKSIQDEKRLRPEDRTITNFWNW